MNETKEQRLLRQKKSYRKLIREISYCDKGEPFRKNFLWRLQISRAGEVKLLD